MHALFHVLAAATSPTTVAGKKSSSSSFFLLFILVMFAAVYLLFIRPRNQRMRQQQKVAKQLNVGDLVVSIGGVFGTLVAIDDDVAEVEVAPGVVMTFLRRAVNPRPGADAPTPTEAVDEEWPIDRSAPDELEPPAVGEHKAEAGHPEPPGDAPRTTPLTMRRSLVWSLVVMIGLSVVALGATIAVGHSPLLGLDLKGGVSVVLQPQGTANAAQLKEAVSIIDRRVNGLGVSNSNVARQGSDVVINLPGIKNPQAALKVLGETATLYFRPVICAIPAAAVAPASSTTTTTPGTPTSTTRPSSPTTATSPTTAKKALGGPVSSARLASFNFPAAASSSTTVRRPPTTPPATVLLPTSTLPPARQVPVGQSFVPSASDCGAANSALLPTTPVQNDLPGNAVILPYYDGSSRLILGKSDMAGSGVADANVQLSQAGQYTVNLTFTSSGSKTFDTIAAQRYPFYKANPNDPRGQEAFELDGVVQSAPTIDSPSFNGTAVISGATANPFTSKQASQLALVLKYGSLPVRFVPQSVQTVSATIGSDSLRAGLLAGLGGIIIVLLYMILYYRALGLVVLLGLCVGGGLLYSIITELSQTSSLALTLAGVTGIIVSVGITVDSYVVYFERLKDEVRAGRTVRQSVERSFARAFRTVLTADSVAFLAALILYEFTVGDVRGFAFMLGLSTLLDVGTAYFFIRPMVILVGRRRAFTEARFIGVGQGLGARQPAGEV